MDTESERTVLGRSKKRKSSPMQMIICSTRVRVIPSARASDTVTFLRFSDERIRDVQGHLKVTV